MSHERRARRTAEDGEPGAEVRSVFEACAERLGEPTILINDAGIYPVSSLLVTPVEEWDAVLDTNLRGVHQATQEMARRLVARGAPGAIVNVASIEGEGAMPDHAHYNASKAGVIQYTRSVAVELDRAGSG